MRNLLPLLLLCSFCTCINAQSIETTGKTFTFGAVTGISYSTVDYTVISTISPALGGMPISERLRYDAVNDLGFAFGGYARYYAGVLSPKLTLLYRANEYNYRSEDRLIGGANEYGSFNLKTSAANVRLGLEGSLVTRDDFRLFLEFGVDLTQYFIFDERRAYTRESLSFGDFVEQRTFDESGAFFRGFYGGIGAAYKNAELTLNYAYSTKRLELRIANFSRIELLAAYRF